jgi:hypothetical protein
LHFFKLYEAVLAIALPAVYLTFAITVALQVHSVDASVGASASSVSSTSSTRKKEIQVVKEDIEIMTLFNL